MSDRPVSKFFGGLLIAAGAMIVVLCGLCSLSVGGQMLGSAIGAPGQGGGALFMLGLVAICGGVPILIGIALIVGGRAMMRPSGPTRSPPPSYGQDPPDDAPRADL